MELYCLNIGVYWIKYTLQTDLNSCRFIYFENKCQQGAMVKISKSSFQQIAWDNDV